MQRDSDTFLTKRWNRSSVQFVSDISRHEARSKHTCGTRTSWQPFLCSRYTSTEVTHLLDELISDIWKLFFHLFIFSVHIWTSRIRDSFGNNGARRVFESVYCHKQKLDVVASVLIETAPCWGILWRAQWVLSSGETKVKNHFCICISETKRRTTEQPAPTGPVDVTGRVLQC